LHSPHIAYPAVQSVMKQSLELRIGQQLAMTPQLQQSIRLLQLSTLELQMEVQQALESNLMLEPEDESEEPAEPNERAGGEHNLEVEIQPIDIPQELPVDSTWEDIYDAGPYGMSTGEPDTDLPDINEQKSGMESLHDYLYRQMEFCRFNDIDRLIAIAIIDAIDDDGYLQVDIAHLAQSLSRDFIEDDSLLDPEIDLDQVESVLHRIQSFEPTGVGARDLRDCLLLQLANLPQERVWRAEAIAIVQHHLHLLAGKNYTQLMRGMALDRGQLQEVVTLIRSLNPRPGSQISAAPISYVIPDVFVKKIKGRWHVDLNQETVPKVRINSYYAGLVRRADNSADNTTLKNHLQEARRFLKSLRNRSDTLLKVATCIVEHQQAFLEYGEESIKPMVTQDIAETLGVHASTISRVTTRKYMHTPRGVYELKYLFSGHVNAYTGDTSSIAIRALIKKLIAAEPPQKPVSDAKLVELLSKQGIDVARRTVAKYREGMGIPSSTERKRLL